MKKAIDKANKTFPVHQQVTDFEKEKIKALCGSQLLDYRQIADLIIRERYMEVMTAKISEKLGELTEAELDWIFDCSSMGVDEMIELIRKSRRDKTPLPAPK